MFGFVVVQRLPLTTKRRLKRRRTLLAGISAIGTGAGIFVAWRIGIGYLVGTFVPGADGSSLGPRIEQWNAAIEMARDYPLFGVGGGNFELLSTAYGTSKVWAAHSFVFEFLADTGVVGLTLYLLLLGSIIYYTIRAYDAKTVESEIVSVVMIWFVAFLVLSMMDQLWDSQAAYSVFYLLAGMTVALGADDGRD